MRIFGISLSRTLATSQTVDRSPITKTGSLEAERYCPMPTLRWTIVPAIGARICVSALIVPFFSKAAISASVLPNRRRRLFTASRAPSAVFRSLWAAMTSFCADW